MMLKNSSNVFSSALVSGSMKSTAGGGVVPRNADRGCILYSAWVFSTFVMSAGLNSCVRITRTPNCVSDVYTFLMPSGVSPVQSGPAIMMLPASLPVVRDPA